MSEENEDLWNQITYLTNKRAKEEKKQKELRAGNSVSIKKINHTGHNLKKLDDDTGDYSAIKTNQSLCKIIQQTRSKLGIKQKDLANKLNINVNDYNKYESGVLKPDNKILIKLQHHLKVKLTGKQSDWGKSISS